MRRLILAILMITTLLLSGTGERFKTVPGRLEKKDFSENDWRNNWTVIMSMHLDNDNIEDLFFYDPKTGEAETYKTTPKGIKKIHKFTGFRKTWKNIVVLDYNGDSIDDILFYDPINGAVELYEFNGKLSKKVFSKNDWRKNWKTLLAVNADNDLAKELLLYDPVTGHGEFLDFKTNGTPKSMKLHKDWRKGWHQIMEVNVNHDKYSDLLFYDQDSGHGQFYNILNGGYIKGIKLHKDWRKNWRIIKPGNFGSGRRNGDLFFYNPNNGEAEYYQIKTDGNIKNYKKEKIEYRSGWDIVIPGRYTHSSTDGILFYDAEGFKKRYKEIFGVDPY